MTEPSTPAASVWPNPRVPKPTPRWLIPVAVAAIILSAVAAFAAWQFVHETPYERCYRVAYEFHHGVLEELAALGNGKLSDTADEYSDDQATLTCDFLESEGRLGEINDDNAADLWAEAVVAA